MYNLAKYKKLRNKNRTMQPLHGKLDSLISWKTRPDKFQDNDNVSGMGDQVDDFSEQGFVKLTGSPKGVSLIMKDETNAKAMKALKFKRWI